MRGRSVLSALVAGWLLAPGIGRADPVGTALVVGIGTYAGQATLPACRTLAQQLAATLRDRGLQVDQEIDPSAATLRNAIEDLADRVAASPGRPALAYVCGAAQAVDGRLFLLPAGLDVRQPVDPQTQGVVTQAALNALGSSGTLVADLALHGAAAGGPVAQKLRDGLPHGAGLALLAAREGTDRLGQALAGKEGNGAGWAEAEPRLAAAVAASGTTGDLALYVAPSLPPLAAGEPAAAPPAPVPSAVAPGQAAPDQANREHSAAGQAASVPNTPLPNTPVPDGPVPDDAALAALGSPVPPPVPPPAPPAPLPTVTTEPPPRAADHRIRPRPAAPPSPALSRSATVPRTPAARPNARTERIQLALSRRGLLAGPADGVMDGRTESAIRAYQASIGERPSGALSVNQIIQLLNAW